MLCHRPGARVEVLPRLAEAVEGQVEGPGVVGEELLGAVAVVHVPVQDEDLGRWGGMVLSVFGNEGRRKSEETKHKEKLSRGCV